ncbi:MAG: outer membrane protein assembly factor BamD [Acidobacteria bacterium]|nr:outer membrane protein assembly factor BamD [Acidobacteriota bacterium]
MTSRRALGVVLALLLAGCGAATVDLEKLASPSDEVVWEAAEQAMQGKHWDAARQYFRRIVDAFPQSQYQARARIGLADAYMEAGGAGNNILAVSAYREFLTLYPSAPEAAYAQYQTGEAYFRQKNSPDRDQTATKQALEEFQRLLDVYPNSSYVEPARERIRECRQILAQSEFQVGYFYQRSRKAWRAAIGRYERILREYPDYDNLEEVIFRLGEALAAAARFAEALPVLTRLKEEYPNSKWVSRADEILAEMPTMLEAAPEPTEQAGPSPPAPEADEGPLPKS